MWLQALDGGSTRRFPAAPHPWQPRNVPSPHSAPLHHPSCPQIWALQRARQRWGAQGAEAGQEGQRVGTRGPQFHAGRRRRAQRRSQEGTSQGCLWVHREGRSPSPCQPKHQILAHNGHQNQQHGLGVQHPTAGPGAGISPLSRDSRKKYSEKSKCAQPGLPGKKRAANEDVQCQSVYHSSAPEMGPLEMKALFLLQRIYQVLFKNHQGRFHIWISLWLVLD